MMLLLIDKKLKIYFYLILLLLFSTIYNHKLTNYFKEEFKIKKVKFTRSDLIDYNLKNNIINQNIFSINKNNLKSILENLTILNSFEVKKIYPSTLEINLIKTKPFAKIISNSNYTFLGENGKIFKSNETYNNIPSLSGNVNFKNINHVIKIINNSPFKNKIETIKLFPSGRFDLVLKNKKVIKFPIKLDKEFMQSVFFFIENNNDQKNIFDFRLYNKIIVSNE